MDNAVHPVPGHVTSHPQKDNAVQCPGTLHHIPRWTTQSSARARYITSPEGQRSPVPGHVTSHPQMDNAVQCPDTQAHSSFPDRTVADRSFSGSTGP
ncbi:hypothetical protein ACOMHN_004536 [Nucella lapillus]